MADYSTFFEVESSGFRLEAGCFNFPTLLSESRINTG